MATIAAIKNKIAIERNRLNTIRMVIKNNRYNSNYTSDLKLLEENIQQNMAMLKTQLCSVVNSIKF